MSEMKLKRCPFCDSEAEVNIVKTNQGQTASIVCKGCSCRKTIIRPYNYKGDIAKDIYESWNVRKPINRIVEILKGQAEQYRRRGFEAEQKNLSNISNKFYGKHYSYLHAIEIIEGELDDE